MLTLDEDFVKLSADRPIAVAHLRIDDQVPMHGHRFHELSVVKAGSATHVAHGLEYPVMAGTIVLAEAGAQHAYSDVTRLEKRNLYFCTDWLAAEFWPQSLTTETSGVGGPALIDLDATVIEPTAVAAKHIDDELDDIEAELARKEPSQTLLRAAVLKILVHVGRAVPEGADYSVVRSRPELWSTLRAIEALAAAGAPLDRSEMARRIGVSADTLSRLIRAETGASLTDLYQRARIRRACQMLRPPNAFSITEIAHRLGFSDSAHFHRHFVKRMGVSASEWKRRLA